MMGLIENKDDNDSVICHQFKTKLMILEDMHDIDDMIDDIGIDDSTCLIGAAMHGVN